MLREVKNKATGSHDWIVCHMARLVFPHIFSFGSKVITRDTEKGDPARLAAQVAGRQGLIK